MNPRIVKQHMKAYKQKRRLVDEEQWSLGMYIERAVADIIQSAFSKTSKESIYPKKPMLQDEDLEKRPLTENEMQKQREALFMKLRIMQANFNASKGDNQKNG